MTWRNISDIQSQTFVYGFCGNGVASSKGFFAPEEKRKKTGSEQSCGVRSCILHAGVTVRPES
jgi:hypothetical protein